MFFLLVFLTKILCRTVLLRKFFFKKKLTKNKVCSFRKDFLFCSFFHSLPFKKCIFAIKYPYLFHLFLIFLSRKKLPYFWMNLFRKNIFFVLSSSFSSILFASLHAFVHHVSLPFLFISFWFVFFCFLDLLLLEFMFLHRHFLQFFFRTIIYLYFCIKKTFQILPLNVLWFTKNVHLLFLCFSSCFLVSITFVFLFLLSFLWLRLIFSNKNFYESKKRLVYFPFFCWALVHCFAFCIFIFSRIFLFLNFSLLSQKRHVFWIVSVCTVFKKEKQCFLFVLSFWSGKCTYVFSFSCVFY